jgi:predicted phosphodiesterase
MTEVVVLSDIHGNAPALEQVVETEGWDKQYLILGDIIGLSPYPRETISLLQSLPNTEMLQGNHDLAVLTHGHGSVLNPYLSAFEYHYTTDETRDEQRALIQSLPSMKDVSINGVSMRLAHAKPWLGQETGYEENNPGVTKKHVPAVASKMADSYDYVMVGHLHEQFAVDCSKFGHDVIICNPGTLGYDNTYTTLDTETGSIEEKAVEHDVDIVSDLNAVLPPLAPDAASFL